MTQYQIAKYDRNDCLLCRSGDTVMGQVNVRDLRNEFFGGYVIWNLHVYPGYRNKGVASELIKCILGSYKDAPLFIDAQPFYDGDGPSAEEIRKWYVELGFRVWDDTEKNPDQTWMVIGEFST